VSGDGPSTVALETRLGRPRLAGIGRGSGTWSWAFVAMGVSSATSFGLSLLAGRAVGASGLGVVFAGFTAYFMLLTVHRALVTTPLISSSSTWTEEERTRATRAALTVTLWGGVATAAVVALVAWVATGPIAHGLLVFTPWLVFAFANELFRSSLVRDGRARRAAIIDVCWLATMVAAAPLAARIDEVWAIVAAWGLGGVVAALIGAVSTRALPVSVSRARTWWVRFAFPFGRWLALQEGSFVVGFYGLYVVLIELLGTPDLGGLRAAESLFSPFTLLAPALLLAGLPAVSRAYAVSHEAAVRVAVAISGGSVLVTLVYTGLMLFAGPHLLAAVFGDSFEPYHDLVVPMSAGQLALAAGIGFVILLRAEQRGRATLVIGSAALLVTLCSSIFLATKAGIEGAVWGLSLGAAVGAALSIFTGIRAPRPQVAS
jgi:O-antigen/teichoic acid export membrane protein